MNIVCANVSFAIYERTPDGCFRALVLPDLPHKLVRSS